MEARGACGSSFPLMLTTCAVGPAGFNEYRRESTVNPVVQKLALNCMKSSGVAVRPNWTV